MTARCRTVWKAWFAMRLPTAPRWRERHLAQRDRVLRMEFRTFVQVVRSGRRVIYCVLAWRPDLAILFRLDRALDTS